MFILRKTVGSARRGSYTTLHGTIETPVFMNVGTQAAIKGGISSPELKTIGCQVELCNTYHLHLRPGEETVQNLGGLHGFMNWDKPILTDSGGFQVFSLAKPKDITEEGVTFASHIDGRRILITPEKSMDIQCALGADIVMAFDECVANPSPYDYVERSIDRTTRWLHRCVRRMTEHGTPQHLWGINQGGTYDDLRLRHMADIAALDLPGYAIGGLAVGEESAVMYHILDILNPVMPANKPRYLMGVGTPTNIIEAVARGVDFFDCVLPARNARHGHLFTKSGCINIKNQRYARDASPVDPECACPLCQNHSRAYLRHLFVAKEMLALRLSVIHNLWFYNHMMADIRKAIDEDRFDAYRTENSGRFDARI